VTSTSGRRVFLGYLVGILLLQAAWILGVPAYRGIDEFDHAYQAAAVVRGQWHATQPAEHGRGSVVTIPGSIVRAASPVCRGYDYVGHDNCFPITHRPGGLVEVATSAWNYNPAYYLVAGTFARPFSGKGFDYAMRVFTAIVSALLLAWAAALTVSWSPSPWPRLALAAGLTPVFTFSTAIAAPNGISYAAAALLWSALIALARADRAAPAVIAAGTATAVFVVTHTTGLLWTPIVVMVAALLVPLSRWREVWRSGRATILPVGAAVAVACAASAWWIRAMGTNSVSAPPGGDGVVAHLPMERLPVFHVVWALETIAVFPTRSEPAPIPVYLLWIGALALVLGLAARRLVRREVVGLAVLGAFLVVVPTALSIVSYAADPWGWQGRYCLPLWVGVTMIAGVALSRAPAAPRPATALLLAGCMATALVLSVVHVAWQEATVGRVAPALATRPGMVLLAALCVGGYAVIGSTWLPAQRCYPVEAPLKVKP
jgi:hypothetical protein